MREFMETAREFGREEDAVGVVEIIICVDQSCHYL